MVNAQSKSLNPTTADEPLIRIPPKRKSSEIQGGILKPLTPGLLRDPREGTRGTKRGRTNQPPQKVDAKALIRLVPTLSDKDLKHLVSTIVKRRKREDATKTHRPSEPMTPRGTSKPAPAGRPQTRLSPPLRAPPTQTGSSPLQASLPSQEDQQVEDQVTSRETEETHTQRIVELEESDLAGALLRQANR